MSILPEDTFGAHEFMVRGSNAKYSLVFLHRKWGLMKERRDLRNDVFWSYGARYIAWPCLAGHQLIEKRCPLPNHKLYRLFNDYWLAGWVLVGKNSFLWGEDTGGADELNPATSKSSVKFITVEYTTVTQQSIVFYLFSIYLTSFSSSSPLSFHKVIISLRKSFFLNDWVLCRFSHTTYVD